MNTFNIITGRIRALAIATKINLQTLNDKNKPVAPIEPEK